MFGNYSISTASRHPSSLPFEDRTASATSDPYQLERSMSPFDKRTSSPAIAISISQLSQTFDRQRLNSYDADAVTRDSWTVPPYWSEGIDEPSYVTDYQPPSPSTRSPRCFSRRVQRQRDVRALCDPAHLRSISELVERMIDNGDQCGVSQPKVTMPVAASPGPVEEIDSYDSSDDSVPRSSSTSSSLGRRSNSSASESSNPTSPRSATFRVQKHRKSSGRERR